MSKAAGVGSAGIKTGLVIFNEPFRHCHGDAHFVLDIGTGSSGKTW